MFTNPDGVFRPLCLLPRSLLQKQKLPHLLTDLSMVMGQLELPCPHKNSQAWVRHSCSPWFHWKSKYKPFKGHYDSTDSVFMKHLGCEFTVHRSPLSMFFSSWSWSVNMVGESNGSIWATMSSTVISFLPQPSFHSILVGKDNFVLWFRILQGLWNVGPNSHGSHYRSNDSEFDHKLKNGQAKNESWTGLPSGVLQKPHKATVLKQFSSGTHF